MKVSFGGIGETIATFYNRPLNGAVGGDAVKITASGEIGPCGEGERFMGVVVAADEEYAAVQIQGVVTAPYEGTIPALGYGKLAAAGNGAVKTVMDGAEYLVIEADATAGTVSFML